MAESVTSVRVLVIDDDADIRSLLGMILQEAGYDVTLAAGGRAALEAFDGPRPDLVFLDLKMPEVDGWAVLADLEKRPAAPPVIIVSGGADRPHSGPLGRSVMGFLPKPFRVDDVLATAQRTLAARSSLTVAAGILERRRARRRDLLVDARLLSKDGSPLALGKILNLSPGGAQLDLGAALQPGHTVRMAFDIPGVDGPIVIEGRVQWRNAGTMGLSFVDLPAEQAERLKGLLSED